ncbi:metallo-beta-lactamase [Mycobacterium tuberculosis]|nr:metallo-beta-lactamase [Mycobacterium tuberculosis]
MRQSWVPEQAPCSAETRCSLAGRVQPAHGDSTTIGDEIVHYEEWVARGH